MRMKNFLWAVGLVLFISVFSILKFGYNEKNVNYKNLSFNNNEISINQMGSFTLKNAVEYDLLDFLSIKDCYVMINGDKINSSTTFPVNYGDSVDIHLEWSLPNSGFGFTTDDTFVYQFPSNLSFANIEYGAIKDGADVVGYYSIKDNKVTIRYTDEEFLKLSNISGTLNVSGQVTEATTGGENGGRVDLEIPGVGTFPIYVEPQGSLGINKTVKKIENGIYEFELEVTSVDENTNVVIGDNMGDYIHLNKDSIKIYNNNKEITDDVDIHYNYPYGDSEIEFIFMIPKMEDDDKIVVIYQASVDGKGYLWDFNSSIDQYERLENLTNIAGTRSDENPTWSYDSVTVETSKSTVFKEGYYDKDKEIFWWNIYVMPGEKGTTLSDYFEGQEFIEGSLTVYETDIDHIDGDSIKKSDLSITFEDLEDGYTFKPDFTGKLVYIINYATKVTEEGKLEGEVYNEATIHVGEDKVYHGVVIKTGEPLINKYIDDADDKKGIISWVSKINASNSELKNTVFRDILGDGLTLIKESIKINNELIENTEFKLSIIEGGFEIEFGDIDLGDVFEITYDTEFDNSHSGIFINEAIITADGIEAKDDEEYEYTKKENYITKYVNKESDNFNKTGVATWEISVDELPDETENAYIDDVMPDGMEYVPGSAKIVLNRNPYTTYLVTPKIEGNILTFDLTDYINQIQGESGISVFYQSRLKDIHSEAKKYTNKAYIVIDDKEYPEVTASITDEVTKLIDKEAIYNTLTAPDIEYTIKLNEGAADIYEGSNTIILDDQMGSALDFVMGSIEVNDEKWDNYTYDPDTRLLTITLPDSLALTITYKARVNLAIGEELNKENAYNFVKLSGFYEDYTEDSVEIVGEVLESSATSSGDSRSIYVYKYKDGNETKPLEGVEFKLYECEFKGSGNTFTFTGKETLVDTLLTDETGYASYGGISYDTVYKLVETKTVDGYVLDTEERYFVYPGNDGIEYPDNIDQHTRTWTYFINNNYSKININVKKVWDDNNFENRPGYVKVYLKCNGNYVLENGEKKFIVLNNSNNWQNSFENLDKYDGDSELNYTVEEEVPTNYEVKYNTENKINEKDITITNKLTKGSLSISKTVGGNDGETLRDFTFKVTLTDENGKTLTGEYEYTGSKTGTIKSGETISLKHGESITINGLPEKSRYEVIELEANEDRYETTSKNDKGIINFGNNSVEFTNIRNEEPKGSLSISKTVGGNDGEILRNFTFKVTLTDENGKTLTGEYEYTGSKKGTIKSGETISLKHGESITINGLPLDTKYEVIELEANTDRYVTESTNSQGVISETNALVSFTNIRNEEPKGSLSISKIVTGNDGETLRDFTFKVTLTDEKGKPLTGEYEYTGSKKGTIKSGETISLKHGESITINGLPLDTKYEVIELEANTDRYVTESINTTGIICEGNTTSKFENHREKIPVLYGFLTINKNVSGSGAEFNRLFTFKIILKDENGNELEDRFNYSGSKTGIIKSGETISLKHGESITIVSLPLNTKYEVIELEANQDGYKTSSQNNVGEIVLTGNIVTFINTKEKIEKPKEEKNPDKKIYIPQTGGKNNYVYYGLGALISGVLGVYLIKRKCLEK